MAAVVRAILLDGEARNLSVATASASAGKQREPLLRITGPARTFLASDNSGTFSEAGTIAMTITTQNPHHFSGRRVWLDFSGNTNATPATNPSTGSYTVLTTVPSATTFTVNAPSHGQRDVHPGGELQHDHRQHPRPGGQRRGVPQICICHGRCRDRRHLHGDLGVPTSSFVHRRHARHGPDDGRQRHRRLAEARRATTPSPTRPARPSARSPSPPIPTPTSTSATAIWLIVARGQAVDGFRVDRRQRDRRAAFHRGQPPRSTTPRPASARSRPTRSACLRR